jgi:nucleoside-diphosphate-sugar epimerase
MANLTITGSRGFIGTNLRTHLEDPSYEEFDHVLGKDHHDLIGRYGTLIHLSAWRKEDESFWNPEKYIQNNVQDLAFILTKNNFSGIIFPSSIAVYDKDGNLEPTSIYGLTKLFGEKLVRLYCKNHWILRISQPYGPHDRFSVFHKLAYCKKYGETFRLFVDHGMRRDYFHVAQFCKIVNKILEGLIHPGTYNVGSGKAVAVTSFLKYLCDKYDIKYESVTPPIGASPGFVPSERLLICEQGNLEEEWLKYL